MRWRQLLLLIPLASCAHRPLHELALADVAIKAAQKVKADALAPDAYRKAENYYLRAKRDFNEGYYDQSRKFATEARLLAEQAEYKALLKQSQLKGRGADEGMVPDGSIPPPGAEGGAPP